MYGCFWHAHENCPGARQPKTRPEYWVPKLQRNRERDSQNLADLADLGWDALVLWECEMGDIAAVTELLRVFLGPIRWSPASP